MGDPHAVTPSPEVLTATSTAVPFPSAALRTTIRHGPPEQAAALQEADGTTVTVHSHYRLAGLLGEGGQGRVYAAEHAFLGREVAIKICSQAEGSVPARFRNEARLTAMLSHRSIIPIYDAADGVLVMRRLRGAAPSRSASATGAARRRCRRWSRCWSMSARRWPTPTTAG